MDGNKKLYLVKGYYWHDNGYSNDNENYDYFFGVTDKLDIARRMRDEATGLFMMSLSQKMKNFHLMKKIT